MTTHRAAMAGLLLITAITVPLNPVSAGAHAASPEGGSGGGQPVAIEISDPELLEVLAQRTSMRTQTVPTVVVEVLGTDTMGLSAAVAQLGGSVDGAVPGHLVQATMPASKVDDLANVPGADFVQYPRTVNRVPFAPGGRRAAAPPGSSAAPTPGLHTESYGTGTTPVGNEMIRTQAGAWNELGYKGQGVKVGIVDFFDIGDWNATEAGTLPNAAHRFCRDTAGFGMCSGGDLFNVSDPAGNYHHGLAVAEVIKDMAPQAELYLASVSTTSELQEAINYFAANGVDIVSRSLGAPYDSPGDGTGPLNAVADSAVAQGMTWFNSAGNDAYYQHYKLTVPTSLSPGGYVDFDPGPAVDNWLRIDGDSVGIDGIRWSNDWYLGTTQRTDYSIEIVDQITEASEDWHANPTAGDLEAAGSRVFLDANQSTGATPLEAADYWYETPLSNPSAVSYFRIRLNAASSVGTTADTLEIALAAGETEYNTVAGSAAKPPVDSRNPGVVAVGAIETDPDWQFGGGSIIGFYSSQGPTTDGRIKPDVSALAGFPSVVFGGAFHGTSAAAPTAAGAAAVLLGAGLAVPGAGLAALLRHFTTDYGATGPDNVYGAGEVVLPFPPSDSAPGTAIADAPNPTASEYVAMSPAARLLDTRSSGHVGPAHLVGPYTPHSIIELQVAGPTVVGATVPASAVAVALNVTSVASTNGGFIQTYPYLYAANGATASVNITLAGQTRGNFAIVPVGSGGKVSLYMPAGGQVVVDLIGYFLDAPNVGSADGRFIPLETPERWMDSRGLAGAPLPLGFSGPRLVAANETVEVQVPVDTEVPVGSVSGLVVTVTSVNATANGYLRAQQKGTTAAVSTVNYRAVEATANTTIVPVGVNGKITVFTPSSTNVIVDVVGYITSSAAAVSETGLFMTIRPGRAYDSRLPTPSPIAKNGTRAIQITGLSGTGEPIVPAGASSVSANLAVTGTTFNGFLRVYPDPLSMPPTSNLNYPAGVTVSGGALVALDPSGEVTAMMSQQGHVIIDVNGYFLS